MIRHPRYATPREKLPASHHPLPPHVEQALTTIRSTIVKNQQTRQRKARMARAALKLIKKRGA
jgi:hypothetical protein